MEILGVCDNAIAKWGTKFHGYIVMSPDELLEKHKNSLILVAVLDFRTQKSIKENLINQGFDKNKILLFNSSNYSEWAYNDLYFPSDIPLQFSNNEVFVDAGCYDFNTSLDFIHNMNSEYKKIIAFEPNPGQYNICLENAKNIKNVMIYECGLWNKSTTLNFSSSKDIPSSSHVIYNNRKTNIEIKAVKLDDILNGDEATYIKMDIEGAELNALKGAEQTIKKYRPKLAISIYHKLEDIWEIPEYLLKLNRNYKLYIRHHYIIGYVETVLYAI
ncbi:MAG: FkbM family methyltransferase, partial [Oscillospiraceae bacterium]|jgi:FkbM family methyltransferase|nr:FkbM family methyltransferase [Oscillospiraceae bacterium]